MNKPIALLVSDLHFSESPPVFRSDEPSWYDAMRRPWNQIKSKAVNFNVPIVVAGDVFDRWWCYPSLLNMVIDCFRGANVYAVCGQHDLPAHNYEDIKKSAYWNLVEAGVLTNLDPGQPLALAIGGSDKHLLLHGFPWNHPITPVSDKFLRPEYINLAVVHQYVWIDQNTSYPGAPDEGKVAGLKKRLKGFDAAVFGDNHIGFSATVGDTSVINCGTFLIRKSDEIGYRPRYGLLMSDGSIVVKYLRVSEDLYADQEIITENEVNPRVRKALAEEMNALGSESLNFRDALDWFMDKAKTDRSVRSIVYACLG